MKRMIFVNLPVADVGVAREFYTALGFGVDERFSDDTTVSVVLEDNVYVMLMTEERFAGFLGSPRAARGATEVLNAISAESREEVDALAEKALAAGGKEYRPPEDMGFMYGRSFTDPDAHVWEVAWMDPAKLG